MKKIIYLFILFLIPINVFSFNINSKNAILYNMNDNTILYKVKENERVSIASMTKIMTCIVAIENIDELEKQVKITSNMFYRLKEENASVAGFTIGETVTYRDLLYGLMLPSGADAAQALAILTSGSIDNFVVKMNDKAKKLNLKNTHFSNPAGLDSKDNYSSVYDVAQILKYALNNKTFKNVFNASKYTTSNGRHTFLSTRNKYNIDTSIIDGSKTGFTYDAGLCLASTSHYSGVNYLLVTANAPYSDRTNHFKDANKIYKYYFENYEEKLISNKGDLITSITLYDGTSVNYSTNKEIKKYLKKKCDLKKVYTGKVLTTKEDKLNDKLGEYIIKCDDKILYKEDIYLNIDPTVKKDSMYIYYIIGIITSMVLILFFTFIIIIKRKKKRKKRRRKSLNY